MSSCSFNFTIEEFEGPNGSPGRSISFEKYAIVPCGYKELKILNSGDRVKISLTIEDEIIKDSNTGDIATGDQIRLSAKLDSLFKSHSIGLISGGWLPSSFAAYRNDATIFPDSNFLTEIVGRFKNHETENNFEDFSDFFRGAPIKINPLLCVFEGNKRKIPELVDLRAQLGTVEEKLKHALPNARLVIDSGNLNQVHMLVENLRSEIKQKQEFLVELAPKLAAPITRQRIAPVWQQILNVADKFQIYRNSTLMLGLLSTITIPNGRSPAKQIFKFRQNYTIENAYNAVIDFQWLDFLVGALASSPAEFPVIITADRNLALFWSGMNATNFAWDGDGVVYDLCLEPEMFSESAIDLWNAA